MRPASGNVKFRFFRAAGLSALMIGIMTVFVSLPALAQSERRTPTSRVQVELSFAPVVSEVAPAVVNI